MLDAAFDGQSAIRYVSRRELYIWLVAGLMANYALHMAVTDSVWIFLGSLASMNVMVAFACYVIVRRLLADSEDCPASRSDIWIAFAVGLGLCVTGIIGHSFGVGLCASLLALHLLINRRADTGLRCAGIVLAALSAHLVWGQLLFRLLTSEILRADSFLLSALVSLVDSSITVKGTSFASAAGHKIVLVGGCSSFNNVSMSILSAVSAVMLLNSTWDRRDALAMIAIAAVMTVINTLRLLILTQGEAAYLYWHNGPGLPLVTALETLIIVLLSFGWAFYRARRT